MTLTVTKPLARKLTRPARHEPVAQQDHEDDDSVSLRIEFCEPGNYRGHADALSQTVEERFGVRTRFVPSRGGVFEVTLNGRLIFSKRATRRLPAEDEILYHVRVAVEAKASASSQG